MTNKKNAAHPGMAVDSAGGPVVDPSINVIALSQAAADRQDDLRVAANALSVEVTKRTDAAIQHQELLSNVREVCAKEIAQLREQHSKELRQLDYDRQDNVRKVDVLNAATAAERALVAIQTLATSQAAERDTLRALVASTATAVATQTNQQIQGVVTQVLSGVERIAALEKSSYEGAGKQTVRDPMMAEMVAELKLLRVAGASGEGQTKGAKDFWGYIIGAVGILVGIVTVGAVLVKALL